VKVVDWGERGIIDEANMLKRLDDIKTERRALGDALEVAQKVASEALDLVESAELFLGLAHALGPTPQFYNEVTAEPEEPTPGEWRSIIEWVVDKIWVENGGAATIEGPGYVSVFTSCSSP
jgi:hypothetical protein